MATGAYGNDGMTEFKKMMTDEICIAKTHLLKENSTITRYETILEDFKKEERAKVIVCFCNGEEIKALLEAIQKGKHTGHFVILGRCKFFIFIDKIIHVLVYCGKTLSSKYVRLMMSKLVMGINRLIQIIDYLIILKFENNLINYFDYF